MAKPVEKKQLFLLIQKLVAEALGTYILVFFVCGTAFIDKNTISAEGAALTGAVAVAVAVYAIGHVSGSNINPAVSVALAAIGQLPWKLVPLYVLAQLIGSVFASLTLRLLFGGDRAALMLSLPAQPNPASNASVMAWEIIVTFNLMLVICCSAVDPRATKGMGGIAAGGAIFINAIMAGPISGCSMNPARSIGPAIINLNFEKLWIYIISPVVGALAGSSLYYFLQLSKQPENKDLPRHSISHYTENKSRQVNLTY